MESMSQNLATDLSAMAVRLNKMYHRTRWLQKQGFSLPLLKNKEQEIKEDEIKDWWIRET